jgi:hypothetical protein
MTNGNMVWGEKARKIQSKIRSLNSSLDAPEWKANLAHLHSGNPGRIA